MYQSTSIKTSEDLSFHNNSFKRKLKTVTEYRNRHFLHATLQCLCVYTPARGKQVEVFTPTGWRHHPIAREIITNTSEQLIGTNRNKLHRKLLSEYVIDFPIRRSVLCRTANLRFPSPLLHPLLRGSELATGYYSLQPTHASHQRKFFPSLEGFLK